MADFTLREARPADAAAIAQIYRHYVLTSCFTFEEAPPDAGDMENRLNKIRQASLPYLVAEGADLSVLGYAYAGFFHARSAYRYTVENSVYVAAGRTGAGIGTALMQRLIADCTASGYRQMLALIGDRDNAASVRLHERLGFQPAGHLQSVGFKFGRWVDVLQMQLALGNDPAAP